MAKSFPPKGFERIRALLEAAMNEADEMGEDLLANSIDNLITNDLCEAEGY